MWFSECSPSSSPLLSQSLSGELRGPHGNLGSAPALITVSALSTCACVLARTGTHSDGQHSHARCLRPLRQAWAHLHRVALGLLQGLVLLALPGCRSTACSAQGRKLQSTLPHATLKRTSLGASDQSFRAARSVRSPSTQASDFQRGSFLLSHRIELSG